LIQRTRANKIARAYKTPVMLRAGRKVLIEAQLIDEPPSAGTTERLVVIFLILILVVLSVDG